MTEVAPESWVGPPPFPLAGVAVDIRSLFNVGALFRAADAARLAHLHLTGGTGHPGLHPAKIDKVALGAAETVPWSYQLDPLPVLHQLRADGWRLVALEVAPTAVPLSTVSCDWFPLAVVVGHETAGVRPEVLAACDDLVRIPMYGRKQSLNVALAFGVAVLHLAQLWAAAAAKAL
ncbi:MAG: hypothetical protein IT204_23930 [Fimbriimonadaceae bacterium]|nr:hypothetical protein [Fimbriimonadaceae bacterium]